MNILHVGTRDQNMQARDVGKPHAAELNNPLCPSHLRTAIVSLGRTQAADTLHWGRGAEHSAPPTPQKTRSRGCLRAPKQFLHFARSRSSQLVQKKSRNQRILKKLFRKNQSTLANTSNLWGRAQDALGAMPALFLSALFAPAPIKIGGAA
jgi:hypothetical protein